MRSWSPTAALAAILLLSLVAGSCGGGSSGGAGAPGVRIVDAVSGASTNFDVLVNSVSAVTDLGALQATALQTVNAGTTLVQFEPTGTKTVVQTASFATGAGFNYSVMAVQGTAGLSSLVVAQSNAALANGHVRLAFVHAAPGVNTLDVFVTSPDAALPPAGSIAPLSYAGDNAALAPVALDLNTGDYRIRAVVDGDAARTVVFDSGPLTFAAGADLLLAVVPVSGSAAPFSLLATTGTSSVYQITDQRVLLRAANFAPALGTVDAFLDSGTSVGASANTAATLFAVGLAQDSASAYQAVLPGAYRVSMAATGQTAEAVGGSVALAPATAVSVYSIGLGGQPMPHQLQALRIVDDLRAPAAGMANLRVLAFAPDLAAIDVALLDTSVTPPAIVRRLAGNLAYTGASAYLPIASGSYTVALVPTGLDLPLLPASGATALNLGAGSVMTLAIAGCRTPHSGICGATSVPLHLVLIQDK